MIVVTSVLSLAGYFLCAVLIYQNLVASKTPGWPQLTPAVIAVLLHAVVLHDQIYPAAGVMSLSFLISFSLVSWLVSMQILISCLYRPLHSLGIVMFPLTGLAVLLPLIAPAGQPTIIDSSQFLRGHVMIAIIAYSLIMLGALQAVALAIQDHAIRSHHPGGMVRFMPSLHDMENLLFQMIGFGFIFLTTALISGFFFVEDLFAQHLVHKTVLSILGWFILAILLFGRFRFGWRGRTAIWWTLSAFLFIMLAFFGSKLVLEYLVTPGT